MINCHLCGKTVILLTSHLQKTHKWTIKETKDFQKSALHEFKKITKSNSGKHTTTVDVSNEMSTTTSRQTKSPFAFNESLHAMVEPRRKLTWTEMDKLDECVEEGENDVIDSKNVNMVHNIIEAHLNETVNYLHKTYTNLHHALSDLICDERSGDRDIVDGNMDVNMYLQSMLKPSVHIICEGNALEMRRLANLIVNGGYLKR